MSKRVLIFIAFCVFSVSAFGQYYALPIQDCNQGGTQAKTSGLASTNYQQGIVPSCLVTIYYTGTTNPVPGSSVFANATGSSTLGNPFTASATGQFVAFLAQGQGYDVTLSGGVCPNCFTVPRTYTGVFSGSGSSVGTVISSPQYSVHYQPDPGSQAVAQGDPNITTDGSGDLTIKSIHLPYVSGMAVPPANAATASAQLQQVATSGYTHQYAFGDSITAGVGAASCTQPGGDCYVDLLNDHVGSPALNNYGLGGDQMCDTAVKMFTDINLGASSSALVTFMDGTNDAATYPYPGYALGPMSQCQNSMLTWATIPSTLKTLPAALTPAANWTATTMDGVNVIESTTNAAAQQIPYTISYTGQPLVIWYMMQDGNGGCFTVTDSYDTANPMQVCNNAGMPIATKNGGTYGVGTMYFLDNITGRVPGNYNLTIAVTSATSASNIVAIAGVGVIPPAGSGNPVWEGGVPRQWLDGPAGDSNQTTSFYNQVVVNNAAYNQGLGLPVNFVDVRNNWLGTTTEMAASPNTQYHPSNLGHAEIATAFEAPTANQKFVPNSTATPCTGPNRATSAATDTLSLSDSYVLYTYSAGAVISLPPNPGPPYVSPGGRLTFNNIGLSAPICVYNSSSSTGPLTFTTEAPLVEMKGGLSGMTVPPGYYAVLSNGFVSGAVSRWSAIVIPPTNGVLVDQPSTGFQWIISNNNTTTNGIVSFINNSQVAGLNFGGYSGTSGNWVDSSVDGDGSGNVFLGYAGAITGPPTTQPTLVKTYGFAPNLTNIAANSGAGWNITIAQPNLSASVTEDLPNCAITCVIAGSQAVTTYAAGFKQTFSASATTAGLNLAPLAGDPSSVVTGDVWYNSSSARMKFQGASTTQTVAQTSDLPLAGTTGSIGGSALLVNNCSTGTATVTGVSSAMTIQVTPVTDPNASTTQDYDWYGYMSGANTVTVKVCALVAGTPGATTYNVRAIQ
jgi:lysophospholipase L1-like esterase